MHITANSHGRAGEGRKRVVAEKECDLKVFVSALINLLFK